VKVYVRDFNMGTVVDKYTPGFSRHWSPWERTMTSDKKQTKTKQADQHTQIFPEPHKGGTLFSSNCGLKSRY
jgi:hypothetical protein